MKIETLDIPEDLVVFCVSANSFPNGVKAAHEQLHQLINQPPPARNYYGIFWQNATGEMIYKSAAAEVQKGDLDQFNLETHTIPAGTYYYIDLRDFMKDISKVGLAFQKLLDLAPVDSESMGIEWYYTMDNVKCMLKAK